MVTWRCSCALFAIGLIAAPCVVEAAEPPATEWKLAWSDEFDGQEIDRSKWDFDLGNGDHGWGNNELQYYTRESDNAFVKDGVLHIRAVKKSHEGFQYTSARLKTRKKDGSALFAPKYGRFEFRAALPTGQGIWPALWMMPLDDKYGGWAASGEIDVMEARGQEPTKVLGTLHFGGGWPINTYVSNDYILPRSGSIADFHLYGLEWEPSEIRWYVDGEKYATQSFWWSTSRRKNGAGSSPTGEAELNPWPAPFDHPFYLIMNVAVGGNFLGKPDETTKFPVDMTVDYVRVYEKVGGYGPVKPRGKGKLPFEKP